MFLLIIVKILHKLLSEIDNVTTHLLREFQTLMTKKALKYYAISVFLINLVAFAISRCQYSKRVRLILG